MSERAALAESTDAPERAEAEESTYPTERQPPLSTYANLLIWNETEFAYHDVLLMAKNQDTRAELRDRHNPPLTIVRAIWFGGTSVNRDDPTV
jgi:hypothetical protein